MATAANNPTTAKPASSQPTSGADIVVQALVNHGVDTVFAYPGRGQHAAAPGADPVPRQDPRDPAPARAGRRVRRPGLRPSHRQGRASAWPPAAPGPPTWSPRSPTPSWTASRMIAITGQVGTPVIGTDAFQETPIVEVCRSVTKHHYLVTDVDDLARVVREAFHVATTGRPGPVLIDLPKDVQLAKTVPDYDAPMDLPGYRVDDRLATAGADRRRWPRRSREPSGR